MKLRHARFLSGLLIGMGIMNIASFVESRSIMILVSGVLVTILGIAYFFMMSDEKVKKVN